jgi:hypothetical protein
MPPVALDGSHWRVEAYGSPPPSASAARYVEGITSLHGVPILWIGGDEYRHTLPFG